MKENGEDWEKQLQTVVVEVCGLSDIFIEESDYLTLLSKLEGLKCDLDFSLFRKTIFECISLTQRMMKKYD